MKNFETNHTAMLGALLKESEEEVLAYGYAGSGTILMHFSAITVIIRPNK